MRLIQSAIVVGLLTTLAASGAAVEPVVEQRLSPRIVNGVSAVGAFPSVGMVFTTTNTCSGTMIGCQTLLTAAHCFPDPPVPAQTFVYLQHTGVLHAVSSVAIAPAFEVFVRSDFAVVRLSAPVTGILPTPLNPGAEPGPGTSATIVGYGAVSAGPTPDTSVLPGLLRQGAVVTSSCPVQEAGHVCFLLDNPLGPPGEDSGACYGDSGSPLLAVLGGGIGTAVVGVASSINPTSNGCLPPTYSFYSDIQLDHDWIVAQAMGDLPPIQCGTLPPANGPGTLVETAEPSMTSGTPSQSFMYNVAGRAALRFTINGLLLPPQNYDLYVKRGSPPTPSDYDCASATPFLIEGCSFVSPPDGTYHVLVNNPAASSGSYQLTVTHFDPPTPKPCAPLDIDGDNTLAPLTDGVLLLRYLFGFTGNTLTIGALGMDATRDAAAIVAFLAGCGATLDLDGDELVQPLTDGILFLRYLFGFRGATLTTAAVGLECTYCTGPQVASRIEPLL